MSAHRGDDRDRGRSRPSPPRDRSRQRVSGSPSILDAVRMPSPPAGFSYDDAGPRRSAYDSGRNGHRDSYRIGSPTQESRYYSRSHEGIDMPTMPEVDSRHSRHNSTQEPRRSKGDVDVVEAVQSTLRRGADAFLPAKYASKLQASNNGHDEKKGRKKEKEEEHLAYGNAPSLTSSKPSSNKYEPPPPQPTQNYTMPGQWVYDKPSEKPAYSGANAPPAAHSTSHRNSYGADPRTSGPNVLSVDRPSSYGRKDYSPNPPTTRLSTLSVNAGHHSASLSYSSTSGAPPASPLLESYHGTYQQSSPMPSPLLLATHSPRTSDMDVVEPLSPGFSDGDGGEKKARRRARFYDPEEDAERLSQALKGEHRAPKTETLIEILPGLTHEQVMELRSQYKKLVKIGPDKRGVNIAKHIRLRLKDEDSVLMKACYSTALGQWEADAYWANFWYQGDKTRRELLIEALMGRTNDEIRHIKEAFSDKKYKDSLVQCMKTELKEDKFKKAVLLALEERRMEDRDSYGRHLPLDGRLIEDDAEALHQAVRAEKGGETAMIQIVLLRSDDHLREVLRIYEKRYGSNFARDALRKSGNLVGELLAHILNGVINRPVRDALLLHHALTTSKRDNLRRELLISRLVRFHWDRRHLAAIKKAYRERYREDLADAVREGTSGEWGLFCEQLVVTRMPDEVKRFEAVEKIREHDGRAHEREDRIREREKELDREYERQKEREREERRREKEKEKEKERESRHHRHKSNDGLLLVRDSKHRDPSRSRERSRSRRRE
ncbi:putative annexin ANXC4 [Rosellinia necatrix]|uniref:Putative annexin ANXC4 n=1 Tax=Rosellinia necatrix TaxID=77044 RepID=A0A1W2TVT6_ROSNE|nr:putative annexin ANXC4 [Rosellinia necatrix]